MKKILLISFLLLSYFSFAGDMQHLKWKSEKKETVDSRKDRAEVLRKIREEFQRTERSRQEKTANMKYWSKNNGAILGTVPIFGSLLSGVLEMKTEGYYNRTHFYNYKEYENTIDANLGEIAKRDSEKLKAILGETSDILRTKLIWDEFKNNDLFTQITTDLSDKGFKAFSGRAITVLAERTVILAEQIHNNSFDIKVLRESYLSFSTNISLELKNIKEKINNDINKDDITLKIQENLKKIGRAPTSVLGDVKKIGKSEVTISKEEKLRRESEEKLRRDYEELQENIKLFNMYVQSSYEIALNLGLKGKEAQAMGEVVRYVGVAASIGVAYTDPNPKNILNAAIGISSLFAKSKPDPVLERHKELMEAFNVVFDNQIMIMKNQKIIIEGIEGIQKKLDAYHKENRRWFISTNNSFDTVLENQAVMIDEFRELGVRETVRQKCRSFLNSRFNCPFEDLEEPYGDIQHCVDKISTSDSNFTPSAFKQIVNPTIVRGEFNSYGALSEHFFRSDNKENYSACFGELQRVFHGADRDILYAKMYTRKFQSIYQSDVKSILLPLVDLSQAYYSNPILDDREQDLSFNSLLISLSMPTRSNAWSSSRTRNVKRGIAPQRLLSKGMAKSSLENLYHVAALNQYVTFLLEMLPYFDIVERENIWSNKLTLLSPSEAYETVKMSTNDSVIKMLRNALHFINIAIAQQALMSGDQNIGLIENILERKGDLSQRLYRALSKSSTLGANFTMYTVRNSLKYTRLDYKGFDYDKNLAKNLQKYRQYYSNDYINCSFDFSENQYKEGCSSPFINMLFSKFKLDGRMLVFYDGIEKYHVPLPSPDLILKGEFYYSSQLYSLLELKEQVMEKVYMNSGAYERVINDLGFY